MSRYSSRHTVSMYAATVVWADCVSVTMCVCFLTSVEDFRGRFSDDRAVLELVQKALKEVECVMEGGRT